MDVIPLLQLAKTGDRTRILQIQEHLPGLESLTPVRGQLKVIHRGNYLEVSVQAETIVTLSCDRCLQQYNHRLVVETSELIWLDEAANQPDMLLSEQEIAPEDLVEALPPQGYFRPDQWLYEQMCLALPPRQLCRQDCVGFSVNLAEAEIVDQRWASLVTLKQHLQQ